MNDSTMNGRAWNVMNEGERTSYLLGFVDSLQSAGRVFLLQAIQETAKITPIRQEEMLAEVSGFFVPLASEFGELKKAMTTLYESPLNARVRIPLVMHAATMQFNGGSAEEVEKYLATLRALSTSLTPAAV